MRSAALIAVDWGTTHARAYRLDDAGSVLGVRAGPLGINKLGDLAYPDALARLLGDWSDEPVPRIACGMVGSRQGWREVPYLQGDAGAGDLARATLPVAAGGLDVRIVPGLQGTSLAGAPDVMRGEETQLAGAIALGAAGPAVIEKNQPPIASQRLDKHRRPPVGIRRQPHDQEHGKTAAGLFVIDFQIASLNVHAGFFLRPVRIVVE